MKRFFLAAAPSILLIFAAGANAQFNGGPKYGPADVSALVDRVHTDLDHAYGVWHFSNGDRDRLNHAEKQLRDFSQKWNDNKFDKGELDDSISSIQHVLDNNKLPREQRDALSDDVTQLRNMREAYNKHEIHR